MISATAITANLAGLLYLARHRPDGEVELEEAARIFLSALNGASLTIVGTPAWLSVNGNRVPSDAPGAAAVTEHFLAHRVSRLEFRIPPEPADLIVVARVLSAYPGLYSNWEDVKAALGPVATRGYLTEGRGGLDVIHLSDESSMNLTFGSTEDWASPGSFVEQGGLIPPAVSVPTPETAAANMDGPEREDPGKLGALVDRGRSAIEVGDWDSLLTLSQEFHAAEREAVSESSGRLYRLELKRLMSTREITEIAKLAALGERRQEAIEMLNRLGGDATEVLMGLLAETEALAERRGYYSALTKMTDGIEVIIHHLDNPMWYVVRNAADLCGEMRLDASVPELARHIDHGDERVRKSIADALNQIGTREALEPLARMLKDPASAVRVHVVGNLDGTRGRALAMPLMALLQDEEEDEVVREVFHALGRIGTPDAVMALRGVATGELKQFGHKHRIQAVEGLKLAGAAASQVLTGLASNGDAELSRAAWKALEAVTA